MGDWVACSKEGEKLKALCVTGDDRSAVYLKYGQLVLAMEGLRWLVMAPDGLYGKVPAGLPTGLSCIRTARRIDRNGLPTTFLLNIPAHAWLGPMCTGTTQQQQRLPQSDEQHVAAGGCDKGDIALELVAPELSSSSLSCILACQWLAGWTPFDRLGLATSVLL